MVDGVCFCLYNWDMKRIVIIISLFLGLCVQFLAAHSGNTDSAGCHYNRKTGDYHCHNPK